MITIAMRTCRFIPKSQRLLSTTASPTQQRLVISRRAWQAHEKTVPKKPKLKIEKPEDKPWPRNFQIAAVVAGGIFIPYTSVWVITSNPTLRDWFGPYLPMERIRSHFGIEEWGVRSFTDAVEEENSSDAYYQFPMEDPLRVRLQQTKIENNERETITANVYLLGDGQVQETKQVPGSTKANSQVLAQLVGSNDSANVAVDFEEDEYVSMSSNGTSSDLVDFGTTSIGESNLPSRGLLEETHTFSTWYYHHVAQQEQSQSSNTANNNDIDRLRLEYTVEELGKNLRDPSCTRDHDEMRAELKQSKRDLSRLKWKRRLGM